MSEISDEHSMSSDGEDVLDRAAKAKRGRSTTANNGRGKGCSEKKAAALQTSREKSAAARKADGELRKREAALLKQQKDNEREERQTKIDKMEKEEAERSKMLEEHRQAKPSSNSAADERLDRIERMLSSFRPPSPQKKKRAPRQTKAKAPTSDDEEEKEHPHRKVTRASASAEMNRRAREAEDRLNKKAKPDNPHKMVGQRLQETSQMHDMLRSMFPSKFA